MSSPLPDAAELVAVGQLREKFQEQLAKRKENGTHWEFFYGDLQMTRILRGNDGDLELATKWLERFLSVCEYEPMDEMAKKVQEQLDDPANAEEWGKGDHILVDMCGMDPETYKLANLVISMKNRDLQGDIAVYLAFADWDKQALYELDEKKWGNWISAWKLLAVQYTGFLNRESVKAGRMIRARNMCDLKHGTVANEMNSKYNDRFLKDFFKMQEYTCIEHMKPGGMCMINCPWWVKNMATLVLAILPPRMASKVIFLEENDPALQDIISQELLQKFYTYRVGRQAGFTGAPNGELEVQAGGEFEYVVSAQKGQVISWKFTVLPGTADAMLGASDLRFGGFAFWSGAAANVKLYEVNDPEVVVPSSNVKVDDGEVAGEVEVEQDGIVTMFFDNHHSKMRGKKLKYEFTLK